MPPKSPRVTSPKPSPSENAKNTAFSPIFRLHFKHAFDIILNRLIQEKGHTIKTTTSRTKLNGEIRYPEVRVIGTSGEQLGIMSSKEAQNLAREQGVDLVEIAANANPPVVKIIDWGKYQYQKMKEEAKNRKKAREKQSELKQMKIGLKISDNDLNIKVRKMREFLEDGDRVKILIVFRGREMAHKEIGQELLDKVLALMEDIAIVEGKPQFNGRNLSIGIRKK
ncbi:translation initiation factor IF-3 [Candidatus Saccharibacteria bacterium]|nr:translation initiation factor IF-3 [Candidatus Saccharibacteria bacterium]